MKLVKNTLSTVYIFTPVTTEEADAIARIAEKVDPGMELSYRGRSNSSDERFCHIAFEAGCRREVNRARQWKWGIFPYWHYWEKEVIGSGVRLELRGTTEVDRYEVNALRNRIFFDLCRVVYLGVLSLEDDGCVKPCLVVSVFTDKKLEAYADMMQMAKHTAIAWGVQEARQ